MQPINVIKHNLPGAILSVCKAGNRIHHYCSGYADIKTKESLSDKPIFPIGKITRFFTAAIILKRLEEGVVDLDATLAVLSHQHRLDGGRLKLLVDLYPYLKPLTLRELLNHTSGLPSYDETMAYQKMFMAKPNKVWQAEGYLDLITGSSVRYRLGYELPVRGIFSDSATNYIIAGFVLEAASGRKSSQQMRELFDLMDLKSTYYSSYGVLDKKLLPRLAHGYLPISHPYAVAFNHLPVQTYNENRELQAYDVTRAYNFNGLGGAAGLSTTTDLIRCLRALLEGRVLKSSFKQMFEVVPVDPKAGAREDQDYYGLGIYKTRLQRWGDIIWSAGNSFGYGVLVAHVMERNITFALAVNVSRKLIHFHEPTLVAEVFKEILK
ncbi:serine hydrolase domain-containing protein [Coxiella burnetii]|uniref:serine hydrolase domain-containing protein n=1 Tax=Coxiella burnetii TaxID=777 RepID=UPI0000DAEA11|nr:serine hydrolase domain-containing protein [Coxiella burnetii]ABX77233.1 putative beta-lactamase [Coxiella burnetii RSA 331]ATN84026.1 serine hydrolase [Coxiella burnetii]POZ79169.1 serine hydrolase [Coxiella burnetii]